MTKPLIVEPPTPVGQRALRLGSPKDFIIAHVPKEAGCSAVLQEAMKVVQRAAAAQGHFGDVEPFQFEPAARAVLVAAADAVAHLEERVKELEAKVEKLQPSDTPN